ncbi:BTB domain-containing protein [Aphelenchoides besseyi]|nr:BTB domain-containing protein [Aphelenchoides besseyi]KAI6226977.1 BTB domain-containing protein [Aphelenchoides besseyi]
MSRRRFPDELVEYYHPKQFEYLREVGDWNRYERNSNNRRFMDVQLLMNGREEYLHSTVAKVHSTYIAKLLKTRQAPITVELHSCNAQSVSTVVDWMYNGKVQTNLLLIAEDLEASTVLGVHSLHIELMLTLYKLGLTVEHRMKSLNIAMDDRYNITQSIRNRLLSDIIRVCHCLPVHEVHRLSLNTITKMTQCPIENPNEKSRLAYLVYKWFSYDTKHFRAQTEAPKSLLKVLERNIYGDQLPPSFRPSVSAPYHLGGNREFLWNGGDESNRPAMSTEDFPPLNHDGAAANNQLIREGLRASIDSATLNPNVNPTCDDVILEFPPLIFTNDDSLHPSTSSLNAYNQADSSVSGAEIQRSQTEIEHYRSLPDLFVSNTTISYPRLSRSDIDLRQNLPNVFAQQSEVSSSVSGINETPKHETLEQGNISRKNSDGGFVCYQSNNVNTGRPSVGSTHTAPHFQQSTYAYEKNDN